MVWIISIEMKLVVECVRCDGRLMPNVTRTMIATKMGKVLISKLSSNIGSQIEYDANRIHIDQ